MAILTLRPNGASSANEWTPVGAATAWECTDDVTSDGDTSYISATSTDLNTIIALPSTGLAPETTINSITLYSVSRSTSGTQDYYMGVNDSIDNTLVSIEPNVSTSYVTNSITETVNPVTSLPFTVTELTGLKIQVYSYTQPLRITQLYVEVSYVPGLSTNAILFAGD